MFCGQEKIMEVEDKKVLFSGNIGIDYSQFYIETSYEEEDDDDYLFSESAFENQKNGICGASLQGKIFFVASIQYGVITIEVELYSIEPPIGESYEEIVEVSFVCGDKPVFLCEWAHEKTYELALPKGIYRVRYCIKGMDKNDTDADDGEIPIPGQLNLIQFWLAEPMDDEIIKQTSGNAGYWHKEWGSSA